MANQIFSQSSLKSDSKTLFTTTLFHDGDTWKVLRADGAKSDKSDSVHPVLIVTKVVNGSVVGHEERLFISSLYRDDESIDGTSFPKTGAVNAIVKRIWDDPNYVSDAAACQAIAAELVARNNGIITCKRERKMRGDKPIMRFGFTGNLLPLTTINWD